MDVEPITFLNTGLPLFVVACLAVVIPLLIVPASTRSQLKLAILIFLSCGAVFVVSMMVFVLLQIFTVEASGWDPMNNPKSTGTYFLRQGLFAGIVWIPILALMWFNLAQRVERVLGEDKMKSETD